MNFKRYTCGLWTVDCGVANNSAIHDFCVTLTGYAAHATEALEKEQFFPYLQHFSLILRPYYL